VTPAWRHYETLFDHDRLSAWIARLRAAPLAALDTETDSLDPMRARIVGISFALQPARPPSALRHDFPVRRQLPLDAVLAALQPWLEDAGAAKVGQNIKYDTHVLANHGITVRGWQHDTMLQSYVFEAHSATAWKSSRAPPRPQGPELRRPVRQGRQPDPVQPGRHRARHPVQRRGQRDDAAGAPGAVPRLAALPGMLRVYRDIEMPVAMLLQRIERHGVLIDPALLAQQSSSWPSAWCSWSSRPTTSPASPSTWVTKADRRDAVRRSACR